MSGLPESISELISNEKKSLDIEQKIVEELLNDKNLETKTELSQPIRWVTLNVITDFLNTKKLVNSNQILDKFINTSFKYLISKDRKGRLEYIQALQSIKEKQQLEQNSQNPMSMKVVK